MEKSELEQENEILELVERKDRSAFELMVELYGPMLFRYARRMCGDVTDAEDVLQDTFMTAQEKIGQFRGEGRLRNWLFTIAGNACRQSRRKRQGRVSSELDVDEVQFHPDEAVESGPQSRFKGPDEIVLTSELAEKLEESISKIPATNREVLLLRDIEGLSTRETATALGITEEAVKIRLHRARAFVRNLMVDYIREK